MWVFIQRIFGYLSLIICLQHCTGGTLFYNEPGLPNPNQISYTPLPDMIDTAYSTFVANQNMIVADSNAYAVLQLHVVDSNHQPIADVAVNILTTGSRNIITPTQGVTNANGLFLTTFASTKAEPKTITASLDGGNIILSQTLLFIAGPVYLQTSSLSVEPNIQIAGASASVVLTLKDIFDNLANNTNVVLSSSKPHNGLSIASGQTNNGVLSAVFNSNYAQTTTITALLDTNQTLQAGLIITSTGVPNITTSHFTASPSSQVADGNSAIQVQITLFDDFGNLIVGEAIALSANPNTGIVVSPLANVTNSNGYYAAQLISTIATTTTLIATTESGAVLRNEPVVSFVAGPAAALSFLVSPGIFQELDNAIIPAPQVAIVDLFGNLVNSNAIVTLALQPNSQSNALQGNTVVMAVNGIAQFSNLSITSINTNDTLLATSGNLIAATSTAFNVVAGEPPMLVFVAQPNNILANDMISPSVMVQQQDFFGNILVDSNITIQIALLNATNNANLYGTQTAITNNGNAYFSNLSLQTSGTYQLIATATGYTSGVSHAFNVMARPVINVGRSTFLVSPARVPADGNSTATAQVVLRDIYGNPIANQQVSVTSSDSNDYITQPGSAVTDTNGSWIATITSLDVGQHNIVIQVNQGLITKSLSVTFFQLLSVPLSTFTISPASQIADGITPVRLSLQLRDTQNNPIANQNMILSSDYLSFFIADSNIQNRGFGDDGNTVWRAISDANGMFDVQMVSSIAANQNVTAFFSASNPNLVAQAIFYTGPPVAAYSTLTASPSIVDLNTATLSTVTLTAYDALGNLASNQNIACSLIGPQSANFINYTAVTNANGQATCIIATTVADIYTVETSFVDYTNQGNNTVDIVFMAGLPNLSMSSLVFDNGVALPANHASVANFTLTLRDQYNNIAKANTAVEFVAEGSISSLWSDNGAYTNANGMAFAHITSSIFGLKTLVATLPGNSNFVLSSNVVFFTTGVTNQNSFFVASPNTQVADGNSAIVLTVFLTDIYDVPVVGEAVTFSSSGNAIFSSTNTVSDANGMVTIGVSSTSAGTETVVANLGETNPNFALAVYFYPGPPDANHSQLVAQPNHAIADGNSAITLSIALSDKYNNIVSGKNIGLVASGAATTFYTGTIATYQSIPLITDNQGIASTTITSTKAQNENIILTINQNQFLSAFVVFNGTTNANQTYSSFVATPNQLLADGASTSMLVLIVNDNFNNPIAGYPVILSSSGNATFSLNHSPTDSNGKFMSYLSSTSSGNQNIMASIPSLNANFNVSVMFLPNYVSAIASTLVASPNTQVADGNSNITLTASLFDADRNPVPYQNVTFFDNSNAIAAAITNANGVAHIYFNTTLAGNHTIWGFSGSNNANITTQVLFYAGPMLAAESNLTASVQYASLDNNTSSLITFTARDMYGNLSTAQNVTFVTSGGNLSVNSNITDANGVVKTVLSTTTPGMYTVTANSNNSVAVVFVAGSPNNITSSLTVIGSNPLYANGNSNAVFTLQLKDAYRNIVAINTPAWLTTAGALSSFIISNGAYTDANGIIVATMQSAVAGLKTVTATLPSNSNFSLNTNITFVVGLASSDTSSFIANPNAQTADGNTPMVFTLTLLDANSNPIANQNIVFSSDGNAVFNNANALTNTLGVATANAVSNTAGNQNIMAYVGGGNSNFNLQVQFYAGSANYSILRATPNPVALDNNTSSIITLIAHDTNGNPLSNQNINFAVSNATLSSTTGITDQNGYVTTAISTTVAGVYQITASYSDIVNSNATLLNVSFLAGRPNQSLSSLTANYTNPLVADGSHIATFYLNLKDRYNNPAQAGIVANLQSTGSMAVFNVFNGSQTDSNGMVQSTLTSDIAGVITIAATLPSNSNFLLNSNARFVAGSISNNNSTFVASPNTQTVGNNNIVLTLTLLDVESNPIANQNIVFISSGTGALSSNTGITNSSGIASVMYQSTVTGNQNITAITGGANPNFVAAIYLIPGNANAWYSSFSASPNVVTANNSNTSVITLVVRDRYNNILTGQNTLFSASNTNVVFLSGTMHTTDNNGTITFDITSTKAATTTITATTLAPNLNINFLNTNVVFSASSSPNTIYSSFVASPHIATTGGNILLVLTLMDDYNNPISNQQIVLASDGNATFSNSGSATNRNGIFTSILSSNSAVNQNIFAYATPSNTNYVVQVGFSNNIASIIYSNLQANPNTQVADGNTRVVLLLTLKDFATNPIGNQTVVLSSNGNGIFLADANATFPGSGSNANTTWISTTNSNGVLLVDLVSSIPGNQNICAYLGGSNPNVTTSVNFYAGAVSNTNSTLSATVTNASLDNYTSSVITLIARDKKGNLSTNQNVLFATSGGNLSIVSGSTDSNGQLNTILSTTKSGTYTVTSSYPNASGSGNNTIGIVLTAGNPNLTQSYFVLVLPSPLTADGNTFALFNLYIKDQYKNPINAGVPVLFTTAGTLSAYNIFNSSNTDANGMASMNIVANIAGTKTVNATLPNYRNFALSANVIFVAGTANRFTSLLTASPNVVIANNSNTTILTLLALDANKNPVANQNVSFVSTGGNNTIAVIAGATNSNGIFSTTMRSKQAQTKTITATYGPNNYAQQVAVVFVAGSPNTALSTFIASPNQLVANGNTTSLIILTLYDNYFNIISGADVTLTSSGSYNAFGTVDGNTNISGIFSTTLSSVKAETKTIQAHIANGNLTTTVVFNAGSPNALLSSFVASPNNTTGDGNGFITLIYNLFDAYNNPVSNTNVVFSASGRNNIFSNANAISNTNGIATSTLSSTSIQYETVRATALNANLTLVTNVNFLIGPPSALFSSLVASPNQVVANANSKSVLKVTVYDAASHPIQNQNIILYTSGYANYLGARFGVTNANGVFITTLASAHAQVTNVSALFGAVVATANVLFTAPVCSTAVWLPGAPDIFHEYGIGFVESVDVNHDGYLDLIFNSTNAHTTMSVALGNGDGTYQNPVVNVSGYYAGYSIATGCVGGNANHFFVTYDANNVINFISNGNTGFKSVTAYPTFGNHVDLLGANASIAVADINADGYPDVVTLMNNFSIGVFLGNANGSLQAMQAYTLNDFPLSVALADYNNDGAIDIAVTTMNHCELAILFNANNTTFLAPHYIGSNYGSYCNGSGIGIGYGSLLAKDVDKDGNIDLVVASSGMMVDIFYGLGGGTFPASPNHFLVSNTYGYAQVAIADYNNDGILDIAVSANTDNAIFVSLGTGNRTFANYAAYNVGYAPSRVIAKDINADGIVDLVVANQSSSSIGTLLGFGDGTFPTSLAYTNNLSSPTYVAVNLCNNDNIPDLVYTDSNHVYVAFGNGNGTFMHAASYAVGLNPMCIAIADFNQDTYNDLAVVNQGNNTLSVLLGSNLGVFGTAANYAVGRSPMFVAAGNINTDGYPDLVVANAGSNTLSVLLNSGIRNPGVFSTSNANTYNVGASPNFVVIADINSDGYSDIVVANTGGNTISVLTNSGTGTFSNTATYPVGMSPTSIAVGYINHDTYLDLAVANGATKSISILLNQGSSQAGIYPANNPNTYNYSGVANTYPTSIAIGNILGNGNNDIAVAVGGAMSHVVIYDSHGSGVLSTPLYYQSGAISPGNLVLQDINLDGMLDIIILNNTGNGDFLPSINVLLNYGCLP